MRAIDGAHLRRPTHAWRIPYGRAVLIGIKPSLIASSKHGLTSHCLPPACGIRTVHANIRSTGSAFACCAGPPALLECLRRNKGMCTRVRGRACMSKVRVLAAPVRDDFAVDRRGRALVDEREPAEPQLVRHPPARVHVCARACARARVCVRVCLGACVRVCVHQSGSVAAGFETMDISNLPARAQCQR